MSLCDECQAKSQSWLDYRVAPRLKIASGASRDDTAAGVADARRGRFDQWRTTVRDQQALIKSICEERHQRPSLLGADQAIQGSFAGDPVSEPATPKNQ